MDYVIPILFFTGLGVIAGIVLTVAGRFFRVIIDDTVEKLTEQFPGLNCGACGFASCERYAAAIVQQDIAANQCKPGGEEVVGKVGEILGRTVSAAQPEVAFVRCAGVCEDKYDYVGTISCRACELYYNGKESCRFGCSGLGDCVQVCPQGAVSIKNGRAVIANYLCNACGLCIKACPKNIIKIQDARQAVHVACCSIDGGKKVKSVCANGCIGCKICEKKCPLSAIIVRDNLAIINADLCDNCRQCVDLCPVGCISVKSECVVSSPVTNCGSGSETAATTAE
jgi:RnfABCDGE-type electron transport complex B subunit